MRQINKELVHYLRDLLLIKTGDEELVDVTKDELSEMKAAVADVGIDYLVKAIKLFGTGDFRLDNYSSLPMELIFVECILSSGDGTSAASVHQSSPAAAATEKRVAEEKIQYSSERGKYTEPQKTQSLKSEKTIPVASVEQASKQGKNFPEPAVSASVSAEKSERIPVSALPKNEPGALRNLDYFTAHWKEFIDAMRGEGSRRNLDAFLRSACEPVGVEGDVLILGFYYDFHKNYIEDQKYKHLVEKKLREVFGHPYKVQCVLKEKGKSSSGQKEDNSPENPLVQAALEMGLKNPRVIEENP